MPDHNTSRNPSKLAIPVKNDPERLSLLSPEDANWDEQGRRAQTTREWFQLGDEWQQKKAENMESCGKWLLFAIKKEGKHALKDARFCRTRLCPRCQWRRANAWKGRFINAWERIKELAPKGQYIFLTLTVPNVPVTELKKTLEKMNKAWDRMTKRKGWPALGFARSTEVTIEKTREGYVHPHFHALVMVRPSYFTHGYMTADVWLEWWAAALKMDVSEFKGMTPNIKAVKGDIGNAVKEVFKYAVKGVGAPDEDIDDCWIETFLELDRQLKGTRAQALGGVIRKAFKNQGDITEEEMVGGDELPDEETIAYWLYQWNALSRWYARSRVLDSEEVQFLEMKEEEKKRRKGAARSPLPETLRASPAMKDDWDLNRIGLQLNMDDQAKKSKKRKTASRRPDKGLPS